MAETFAFKTTEGKNEVHKAYDDLLSTMKVSHEKLNVETRFGKAFVIAAGKEDAPVLVLLHGSGMNSIMWVSDIEKYSKDYRVYAVDLQGEPGKSDDKQISFKNSDFDNWLYDVFIGLSIKKASIIGISLGAWLALKFAIANTKMVDKLVLLCPAGIGPQKSSFAFVALFYTILGEKGVEKLYKKVNGGETIPKEMMDYQKLIGKHFNFRKEQIPLFSDNELRQLAIPSILFAGEKDVMLHSMKTAKRYRSLVPNSKVIVLPEAGHTLIRLVDDILTFLRS